MRSSILCAAVVVSCIGTVSGATTLPGETDAPVKLDVGLFDGGSILNISASGTINIIGATGWNWVTNPDGSLVVPVDFPAGYSYANVGATNYPTADGGDGINHYPGGGANYDTSPLATLVSYGFAGEQTTDTTDSDTIRFGAIVGTFSDSPNREDWFLVGTGTNAVVPFDSAHLYLAIHDSSHGNNTGAYQVSVSVVPEPSTLTLLATLGTLSIAVGWGRRR